MKAQLFYIRSLLWVKINLNIFYINIIYQYYLLNFQNQIDYFVYQICGKSLLALSYLN